MRLDGRQISTDHDRWQDVNPADHHPPAYTYRIALNSQSIGAGSAYQHREALGNAGHKLIEAVLRGNQSVNVQGHTGVFAVGTEVPGECSSLGIKPINYAGYVTSYMGVYSRIHGDSYLTPPMFGGLVRLRDLFIDTATDEAVIEFFNASPFIRFFSVFGTVRVK